MCLLLILLQKTFCSRNESCIGTENFSLSNPIVPDCDLNHTDLSLSVNNVDSTLSRYYFSASMGLCNIFKVVGEFSRRVYYTMLLTRGYAQVTMGPAIYPPATAKISLP